MVGTRANTPCRPLARQPIIFFKNSNFQSPTVGLIFIIKKKLNHWLRSNDWVHIFLKENYKLYPLKLLFYIFKHKSNFPINTPPIPIFMHILSITLSLISILYTISSSLSLSLSLSLYTTNYLVLSHSLISIYYYLTIIF